MSGTTVKVKFVDDFGGTIETTQGVTGAAWSVVTNINTLQDGGVTITADVSDASGNLAPTASTSVTLDKLPPIVTNVLLPLAGTYVSGQALEFKVGFDEPFTLGAGSPQLDINIGASPLQANFSVLEGTNTLKFSITLIGGENGIVSIGSNLTLGGATIQDDVLNDAVLTLAGIDGRTDVIADAVLPTLNTISMVL